MIETLVALAILGAVAASILVLVSQNTRFTSAAEERMLAGILVDNLMTEALSQFSPLERGEKENEVAFARRRFLVDRAVVDAGANNLVRIEIEARDAASGQVLANAISLKAEGR